HQLLEPSVLAILEASQHVADQPLLHLVLGFGNGWDFGSHGIASFRSIGLLSVAAAHATAMGSEASARRLLSSSSSSRCMVFSRGSSCPRVRALAIGAVTPGWVRSQARAIEESWVPRAVAICSRVWSTRSPCAVAYC